ncbi:MAG: hypothetical protein ACO3QS_07810 [Burkholderiaceae bacterium]
MDTTPRDPHLPPPAVVDWLLDQNWSAVIPETFIHYHGSSPHGMSQSNLYEYQLAFCEIGADTGGRVSLPVEALDALRKDRDDRQSALEGKQQACEFVRKLASLDYTFKDSPGSDMTDELAIKVKR